MSDDHGKFCWYELSTTDVEAAKGFYGALIGFGTHAASMPGMEYAMWLKPGTQDAIGGVSPLAEGAREAGAPPNWMLYIHVDDIDATFGEALSLGATAFVPVSVIPGFGRFALLTDPQGAAFALYQGEEPQPIPEPDGSHGSAVWHELMTSDLDGAAAFYGALFGWTEIEALDLGEMGPYRMFGPARPGAPALAGMMARSPEMPQSSWMVYFHVPSADEAAARVPELGGTVVLGPQEIPGGGRIVTLIDPQGALVSVHSDAA